MLPASFQVSSWQIFQPRLALCSHRIDAWQQPSGLPKSAGYCQLPGQPLTELPGGLK